MSHLPDDRSLALAPLLRRSGSVIESQIRGSSMAGALSDGTRIRIRCGSSEVYPTGTVIAFIIPGGLVGHRVVAVSHGRGGRDSCSPGVIGPSWPTARSGQTRSWER